jgi:hypothetical protein
MKYSWREIIASFWPLYLSAGGIGIGVIAPDEEALVVPLAAEPAAVVLLAPVVVVPAAVVPLGAVVPAGALVALPAGRVAAAAVVGAVVAAAPVVGAVVDAGFGVSVALLPPQAARIAAAALAAAPPRNPRRVNREIRASPSSMSTSLTLHPAKAVSQPPTSLTAAYARP